MSDVNLDKTKLKNLDNNTHFEDATENVHAETDMDLLRAAEDTNALMHLFISNKHNATMEGIKPWADKSIYHSLARATINLIRAFLTYEPEEIKNALEEVKKSVDVCNGRRRRLSIVNNVVSKMVKRPNYNSYTEEEVHAELCYAECLLMRALLTFIQDDNLISFVKGGLRVRLCYQAYKECQDMIEHRTWPNATLKRHFESGVKMGLGAFNLFISCLPSRVLRLLEFVGFSGDRDLGLSLLEEASKMHECIRGPLAGLGLFLYYTIVKFALGNGDDGQCISKAEQLMERMLEIHPESVFVQFSAGRLESVKGNFEKAIELLEESRRTELDWVKFRHIAVWELAFCQVIVGNFRSVVSFIEILHRENNWSKCISYYMKGIALFSCDDFNEDEAKEVVKIMKEVPNTMQRISGKSIPIEKFVVRKAERYVAQGNWLMLPFYEMMYISNYFANLKGKNDCLTAILTQIERGMDDLNENHKNGSALYVDNYCLGLLLKGICLRHMGSPLSAEELFVEIYNNVKKIKEDKYLISFALMELGFICEESGDFEQAVEYLNAAKEHKMFHSEFRIHEAMWNIRRQGYENGTYSLPMIPMQEGSYTPLIDSEELIAAELENTHM